MNHAKLTLKYASDLFFKYMMKDDQDTSSILIRQIIIEEGLHLDYFDTTLLNPNLLPKNEKMKNMYLDALLKDEKNRFIHLEMQRSPIDKEQKARMSAYGNSIIIDHLEKGKPYNNGIEVYQCIFVDDNQTHTALSETYKKVNEEGIEYGVGMVYTTYLYISYIDEILKQKKLEELNSLECIIYVFRYGINYDILKLRKGVINAMAEKMEEYISNYAKILEKRSYEDFERHQVWMKQEIENLGKETKELTKENIQLKQERVKAVRNLIKHGFTIDFAIETLEVPQNQREELKKLIDSTN